MADDIDLTELARQMRVNAMASSLCTLLAPHVRAGRSVPRETVDFMERLVAELFQMVDNNVQCDENEVDG